jgi:hypothetical protein
VRLWRISRLCEEFGRTPVEIERELAEDPEQLLVQVAELRGYARAKAAVDAAESDADMDERSPFVVRVKRVIGTLLREG